MLAAIKRHYEKVICGCCFLLLFTNVGLASTSFSVYQPYLVELPGVGDMGGSIVISVRTFVSLIAMFFVARYYDKLDCRRGAFGASLCVGAGFLIYSVSTANFIGLCAGSVFTGLGYGLGGMVASTMLIGRWFKDHVATVAGVAAVGSGVAAVVIPPLVVPIVQSFSLATSFFFEGLCALIFGVILFALLRNRPADMGLLPYVDPKFAKAGDKAQAEDEGKAGIEDSRTNNDDASEEHHGFFHNHHVGIHLGIHHHPSQPKRRARISRNMPVKLVPVVLIAMIFVGRISVGGTSYIAVLFTSEGFSTETAALFVSVNGFCLLLAKMFCGVIFDHIGTRNGSALFFSLFIAGTFLLVLTALGYTNLALLGIILYGCGLSLGTVGISIWSIELAPRGQQVKTIKNFQIAYAAGGFIFTFLPGFLTEATGSYLISYVILLGMIAAAGVVIVVLYTVLDKRAIRMFNETS